MRPQPRFPLVCRVFSVDAATDAGVARRTATGPRGDVCGSERHPSVGLPARATGSGPVRAFSWPETPPAGNNQSARDDVARGC